MHIPIPIPIGIKRVAAVQGAVWKFVTCANCQQGYAYRLGEQLVELLATNPPVAPNVAPNRGGESTRSEFNVSPAAAAGELQRSALESPSRIASK